MQRNVTTRSRGTRIGVPLIAAVCCALASAGLNVASADSIVAWGHNGYGQTDVPNLINSDFVAVAGGNGHSQGLRVGGTPCVLADLNCDGVVDIFDLLELFAAWAPGRANAPPI